MIIDAFLYSYDEEALKIRKEVLSGVVDVHLAIQGSHTFQGDKREISTMPIPGVMTACVDLSPLGSDFSPWHREAAQRNACADVAQMLFPGDDHWIIVSDGDEIPHPAAIHEAILADRPMTLMTDARSWFVNWRYPDSQQLVHQPVIGRPSHYAAVGGANDARWSRCWPCADLYGWHLSGLGDPAWQQCKAHTFAHAEYRDACDDLEAVAARRDQRVDFLGRFALEKTDDLPPVDINHIRHLIGD